MVSVKPERSLAVRCPQVAAMWHPVRNEDWTPRTISATSDLSAWWMCAAGHEWSEPVRSRSAPRKWKRGDLAACGLCSGYHVLVTCACGDQRLTKAAEPSAPYVCWKCVATKDRERMWLQARRAAARTDYVPDFAECKGMLRAIAPSHLPPVLVSEWCRAAEPLLSGAMVNERGYGRFNVVGAIDDALRRLQDKGDLLPTVEQLRAAHAAGEPIEFMDRTFWTQGVLHVLGLAVDQPRDHQSAASLQRWIRHELNPVLDRTAVGYSTADITTILTSLVVRWGLQDGTGVWRGFLELVPPFIPTGGYMSGRVDVVLTRPGSPDLVVEIDSAHNPRSMEKLRFAHTAGATAVWIRWKHGGVRQVPGVHVIDLRDQTRTIPGP